MSDIENLRALLAKISASGENVNNSQVNVDVCTLTWLLQAVGFNLDSLAFKENDSNASANVVEVKLNCSASGMEAKLSRQVRRCTCPKDKQENFMVHVTGQTAAGTTKTGTSSLIPAASAQISQVACDVLKQLISLHVNETSPEPVPETSMPPPQPPPKPKRALASLQGLDVGLSMTLHTPRMVLTPTRVRSLSTGEVIEQATDEPPERRLSVDNKSQVPPLHDLSRRPLVTQARKRPDFLHLEKKNRPAKMPALKVVSPDEFPVDSLLAENPPDEQNVLPDPAPGLPDPASELTDSAGLPDVSPDPASDPSSSISYPTVKSPVTQIESLRKIDDDDSESSTSNPATVLSPTSEASTTCSQTTVIDKNIETPDEVSQNLPFDEEPAGAFSPKPADPVANGSNEKSKKKGKQPPQKEATKSLPRNDTLSDDDNMPDLPPDTRADDEPRRDLPMPTTHKTSVSPLNCSMNSLELMSAYSSSPKLSHDTVLKLLHTAGENIDEAITMLTNSRQTRPKPNFSSPVQRSNTYNTITTHEKAKELHSVNKENGKSSARRSFGFSQSNIATPVQMIRAKSNLGHQDTPRPKMSASKTSAANTSAANTSAANTSLTRSGLSKKSAELAAKAPTLLERYKQTKGSTPKVNKK